MISKKSILATTITAILLVGCSNLVESTRKSLLGDEKPRAVKQKKKWVSKSQYDDLLEKYKNLSIKHENLKDQNLGQGSSFDQVNDLANSSEASETIDVFGKEGLAKKSTAKPMISNTESPENIDKDLDYFKRAVSYKDNGKLDEALKIFQFLEKSPTNQISVRAMKFIGIIYFEKKQYDLALQVYEGIIRKKSFSGVVITALDYASRCSKQLGLTEKQLKYESILRDFFEVKV
jgi:TolA-binding protein